VIAVVFDKLSRYRTVPNVAAPDATGRVVASKDFRLLPDVTGLFRHTVLAGDRPDQLATTYYGDPLRYWHICDANPDFPSPLAMVDREPVLTTRFPVTFAGTGPPWAALIAALTDVVGVVAVTVVEDSTLVPTQKTVSGQPVTVLVDQFTRAVVVTYNGVNTSRDAIKGVLADEGFAVGPLVDLGQVGQQIVIPPVGNG
jgi:hypothetical protein